MEQGGFDTLNLLVNGQLGFSEDVTLRLNNSLRLMSGSLGMTADARPTASVMLAAPYVLLGGATDTNAKEGYERPSGSLPPALRTSESVLRVNAGLIDIRDNVKLDALTTNRSPSGQVVSYTGCLLYTSPSPRD